MPPKAHKSDARTEIGRELARKLYDYKLKNLISLSPARKAELRAEFPKLKEDEFNYVLDQVIEAKRYEQERVGWQAVPHDLAVLVLVALTGLVNLRVGIIVSVAVLVLLEGLFQFYFDRRLYRYLSALVWLTYPAYLLLAFMLYRQGYELIWIAAAVAFAWGGTFLLGIIARLPVRLIVETKAKSAQTAPRPK
jgi:hypothetical protein